MMRNALVCLGLAVLSMGVFAQTRHFEFINYDDPAYILQRSGLREGLSWPGIQWAFTTAFGNHMPVTELTYLADYSMHGLDAGGYHVTNVALHTLNGLLLFLFLVRTTRAPWPSAVVAALFLVHPLRAESVAWISSRKDLACGLFWIITLHAYTSYASKPRVTMYLATFLGVCLALLSKPMAVTLPCVLLLLDFWPLGRFDRAVSGSTSRLRAFGRLAIEKAPLAVPVIAASVLTIVIQQRAGAVSDFEQLPIDSRIFNALFSYLMYIGISIVPVNLVPMYPYLQVTGYERGAIAAGIGVAGFAWTAFVLLARARIPWLFTGWLWYLGTLVPVIGLVQVGAQSHADRYTYLPQIGLWIALAWSVHALAQRVPRARIVAAACALVAIAAAAVLTHRQTAHWRDSLTLWTYTVSVSPQNAIAHSLLGEAFLQQDDRRRAREHIERALSIQPSHRPALLNIAKLNVQEGRLDAALAVCGQLVNVRADDPDANTTWASILIRQGRSDEALRRLDLALGADPNHPDALINRGAALLLLGRAPEAIPPLERAIRLAPDDAAAFANLATANFALGRYDDARRYVAEALRLDPEYPPALNLRADLDALPPQ